MEVRSTTIAHSYALGTKLHLVALRDVNGGPLEMRVLRNGELVTAVPARHAIVARLVYLREFKIAAKL